MRQSIQYELLQKSLQGLTDNHTIKSYKSNVKDFARWARSEGLQTVDDIRHAGPACVIQQYERVLEENYSPSTIHTKLAPVCKGLSVSMADIEKPRRSVDTITRGRSIDANPQGKREAEDPRYERLVTLQRAVGLRRSELASLRQDSLQRDESGVLCIVVRGKGGKVQLQRVLPADHAAVESVFRSAKGERIFTRAEMSNHIDLHSLRAQHARDAYAYYNEKIESNPYYKVELVKELKARWDACHVPSKSAYARFKADLLGSDGIYRLRGENRRIALEKGLPTEYNRVAMMAVSVFHLSHWRLDVTAVNYITA